MMLVRRIARPMLASTFVVGGVDALLHPQTTQAVSESATRELTRRIPNVPDLDGDTVVRIDGAVMTAAGAMLAAGRMPRLAALALLAAVAPTLVERARDLKRDMNKDEGTDPAERAAKRMAFLGGLGVVGGLLIAAADNGGKPSLRHRAHDAGVAAQHLTRHARREVKHSAREAALAARAAGARLA